MTDGPRVLGEETEVSLESIKIPSWQNDEAEPYVCSSIQSHRTQDWDGDG